MIKKSPVLGVLGGMGPYATQYFFKRILDLTPAKKDWDHLRIIIDNNTYIPSRSRAILYNEESPLEAMINACKQLEKYPVDMIAIPCNSACFFIDNMIPFINVPIVNILEVTVKSINENLNCLQDSKVAVLGGAVTYNKKTYENLLIENGFKYIHHSSELQEQVVDVIEKLKKMILTKEIIERFMGIIMNLRETHRVDIVILGCTEFSMIYELMKENSLGVDIIDSSSELAKYCIKSLMRSE